ncbi:MAG: methylmalonyl-CoA mutase family protein [Candidatus Lokiarchaeota archaeon]|nr:methylmalonyl-CoA mutase family protein [Candidatus Lokiarchaeota archaeon]
MTEFDKIKEDMEEWQNSISNKEERKKNFKNLSDIEIKRLYTPNDIKNLNYDLDLGFPGQYPFTRGAYPNMYRGRLWTMRQFAGFGNAEQTNTRYKFLIEHGQTGLSVAFSLHTIYGIEATDQRALGEIGKEGVAIDTLQDMETLFDGIDLSKISTSMTINAPASILLAMYIVTAEKQGHTPEELRGTIQNDILKEYIAQKSWIFPPEESMRLIVDTIEYCTKHVPQWYSISISGYHIREAGSTAVQELAFTLADGFAYVEAAVERGLDVDDFAPRLSFFFNSHNNFFEEVCKYRAARRIWAKHMKDKYSAKKPESLRLRFHTQTAGVSLTAQEPENNIVRTALQGLAAVLGGTQSLHTNSFDEALCLPTENAVKIALRTQQIIAHESGVTDTVDPLAGSYYVEWLTNKMEEEAEDYFNQINELGGVIPAIKANFFQKEIANASYKYQQEVENREKTIVAVNQFQQKEPCTVPLLKIDEGIAKQQEEELNQLKQDRENEKVTEKLKNLKEAAQGTENLMPYIMDAIRAYASIGEIINTLKEIFGEYHEDSIF